MSRRPHQPLFDDEPEKKEVLKETSKNQIKPLMSLPTNNSYPNQSHKQREPVITPPPQRQYPTPDWTDRSHSVSRFPPSQDTRRRGSAPQLTGTPTRPFNQNSASNSPRNWKNQNQGPKNTTNPERKKLFGSPKKQGPPFENKLNASKSESKTSLDSKGNRKSRKPGKKSENIEVNVRTIQAGDNKPRDSRQNREKAPRRNQKSFVKKIEPKLMEEKPVTDVEMPEAPPKTPDALMIVDELPKTPEKPLLVEETTEEIVMDVEMKSPEPEEEPKTEPDFGVTESPPEAPAPASSPVPDELMLLQKPVKEEPVVLRKPSQLEEDLQIGQFERSESPRPKFTFPPKKKPAERQKRVATSSPSLLASPIAKTGYEEAMQLDSKNREDQMLMDSAYQEALELMERLRAESYSHKKYTMFLPYAFLDPNHNESTISMLYGRFNIKDVFVHYNKNGTRLGSGCMKVDGRHTFPVRDYAADRFWKATGVSQVKPYFKKPVIVIYLMHLPPQLEEDDLKAKMTKEYGAWDVQMIYRHDGKSSRSALLKMKRENAVELSRKIKSPEEFVFESPNTVLIFELLDVQP